MATKAESRDRRTQPKQSHCYALCAVGYIITGHAQNTNVFILLSLSKKLGRNRVLKQANLKCSSLTLHTKCTVFRGPC